uniref:Uncharacterized protein n=1 Tax=Anopheles merus TaxID=30066 RepID=A0A182V1J5_ANOME
MNIKMPDFDVKKFVKGAGSTLSRVVQVIFVCECNPPHSDYMNGKQGLLKGLVPKAFLEMLDDD